MRISDAYRYVDFPHKGRSCGWKRLYSSRALATRIARDHNQRIVCEGMGEYWCSSHQGWHVGHPYRRRDAHMEMKALVEFFILWETQCQLRNGGVSGRLR